MIASFLLLGFMATILDLYYLAGFFLELFSRRATVDQIADKLSLSKT